MGVISLRCLHTKEEVSTVPGTVTVKMLFGQLYFESVSNTPTNNDSSCLKRELEKNKRGRGIYNTKQRIEQKGEEKRKGERGGGWININQFIA